MMQELIQITNRPASPRAATCSVRPGSGLTRLCEALADLLEYPDTDWVVRLERCSQSASSEDVGGSFAFGEFHRQVESLPVAEVQELYTRCFDLNPVCALEVGYHLFGESYKRGVFLARLSETEAPYALKQEHQLPDYLPVLLRLVARLDDEELRASLVNECLLPATARMLEALGKTESPYGDLVTVIELVLKREACSNIERCPALL
jgi:nitrate reductase molybdenum cofactor assembly chaperone NarJ/NarW